MEIVVLKDVPATYATTWLLIANTAGYDQIKINDQFREQGTLEIFGVENVMPSPVAGSSRICVRRGENASPVETHRAGAVLIPVEAPVVVGRRAKVDDLLGDS